MGAEEREEMEGVEPGVTADPRPWRFPKPGQKKTLKELSAEEVVSGLV